MRDAEKGVGVPDARFRGTANEDEIADLVGQLERYAELKTGRGAGARANEPLRATNAANRPRPNRPPSPRRVSGSAGAKWASASSTAGQRWGSKASSHAAGRAPFGDASRPGPEDDENSLVGPWDGASSQYASSAQDSDAQSVYSIRDSEFGLPDAPLDRYDNANVRFDSVSENLEQHRRRLEETMRRIESSSKSRDPLEFMDTDGMPTAGKTRTGVGVFDIFAKDAGDGAGKARKPAGGKAERWLSPAPGKKGSARTGMKAEEQEQSAFMRFVESVFGCCMGRKKATSEGT